MTWKTTVVTCAMFFVGSAAAAQTTDNPKPVPAAKAHPASKPAAAAAPKKPAVAPPPAPKVSTNSAQPAAGKPASPSSPATAPATATIPQAAPVLPGPGVPATVQPTGQADSRGAVQVQGLHDFIGGQQTLTVYGCFRSATRAFCDFDLAFRSNQQFNAANALGLRLSDDSGKPFTRHNAFFVASDGSRMPAVEVGPDTPRRLIMEFDDIPANAQSVALSWRADTFRGIPISTVEDEPATTHGVPTRETIAAALKQQVRQRTGR
jgi:hypothetical protein